jgi:hypothetical protein
MTEITYSRQRNISQKETADDYESLEDHLNMLGDQNDFFAR